MCITKSESGLILDILDWKNKVELDDYENKLFKAFHEPKSWIGENYNHVNTNGLRSMIPYQQQKIFIVKEEEKFIAANAVNLNLSNFCQIKQMGYNFLNADEENICEGIGFFIVEGTTANKFEIGNLTTIQVFDYLKRIGYKKYFGTSSPNLARLYTKLYGFNVIDSFIASNNEEKLLLLKIL